MLDGLLTCLGVFAGLVVLLVTGPLEQRRLRAAEEQFLRGRPTMADAEFLRRAGAGPAAAPFFLAARRVMAGLCTVPPEMVHPEDTVRSLLDLQPDQGYIDDFVFGLEAQAGVDLPCRYPPDRQPFGEYVGALARRLGPPVGNDTPGSASGAPGTADAGVAPGRNEPSR